MMKISVIIGSRERFESLMQCLESVFNQDYASIEVLVLDDCSTKQNLYALLTERVHDARARLFRSDRQLGVAGSRNFLMQQASGDILCCIDDDALFQDKNALSKIANMFLEFPEVGILAFLIYNHAHRDTDLFVPFSRFWRWRRPEVLEKPGLVSYFIGTCHAVRRSVIEQVGGYQHDLIYGQEELDLSFKTVAKGFKILYVPDVIIHHYPLSSVVQRNGQYKNAELYYYVRNRLFLAYKYLPVLYIPVYLAIWLARYSLEALKNRAFTEFFNGVIDGFRGLRNLERMTLNSEAISYLRSHYGRLWY